MKYLQIVHLTHGGKNYHCCVYPSTVEVSVEVNDRYARAATSTWRSLRSGTAKHREIAALAIAALNNQS